MAETNGHYPATDMRSDPLWPEFEKFVRQNEVKPCFEGKSLEEMHLLMEWRAFKAGADAKHEQTIRTFMEVCENNGNPVPEAPVKGLQ